jgi:hypothetical protein
MKEIFKYFLISTFLMSLCYYTYKKDFFGLFGTKPQIEIITEKIKNFGVVKKDKITEHYFKFKNIGDKDLLIFNVETTCGCTAPIWNEKPIKKNEVDSVKITYDSSIIGEFDKPIFIYSNSEEKQVQLRIKGEIIN